MISPGEIAVRCATGVLGERTNYKDVARTRNRLDGADETVITGAGVRVRVIAYDTGGGEANVSLDEREVGRLSWTRWRDTDRMDAVVPADGKAVAPDQLGDYEMAVRITCQIAAALAHVCQEKP